MGRYILVTAVILLAFGSIASASTVRGRCLLQVHGHTYLRGPCYVQMDKWGYLQIDPIGHPSHYHFAVVSINRDDPNTSNNSTWNGVEGATHAHEPLGKLIRHGACWLNSHAKVCAWRK